MSTVNTSDDQAIIRYLLGDLGDSEAEKIEEACFLDAAFEEHVGVVEDSLIQDFLQGLLSSSDVVLFQRKYLNVPELRAKVAFANRLHAAARGEHRESGKFADRRTPRHRFFSLASAFALLGILCLVLSLLIFQMGRRSNNGSPGRANDALSRQAYISDRASNGEVVSMVLVPGQSKGLASGPRRLLLGPDCKEVRLELDLPGIHAETKVRAEVMLVESNGRKLVWSRDDIPSVPTLAGRTVVLALDPKELRFGDYIIYLRNSSRGSGGETLESYVFGVVGP